MRIVYSYFLPTNEYYDKRWKKIALKLGLRPRPDRVFETAYVTKEGIIILPIKYKEAMEKAMNQGQPEETNP